MSSRFGLSVVAIMALMTSCQKPSDYLYVHAPFEKVDTEVKIKEFVGTNQVDLLWVIDNSGSMDFHQRNVIANMDLFIQSLVGNTALDWKAGLISTSIGEPPYAGFAPGTELLSSDPNVAVKFKQAVAALGTNGDATERTFDPIVSVLGSYPKFLRPNAALAIIVISDAPEQSNMNATSFVQYLSTLKPNMGSIYFYGFLNPDDWCTATDDDWQWSGSPFEYVTQNVQGHVYKLCDPNFSANLADLGTNLGKQLTAPLYYLKNVPRVETLKVIYKGQELPGGPQSSGGKWGYRPDLNAVEFWDLSFAPGLNETVRITYDVDNGTD